MTIKVYVSGICGSHDVRKQQQRVLFILSTLPLDLEIIDVTEPGREEDRTFMQEEAKKHNKQAFLPPQIFHDKDYCGDYDDFQLAADDDVLMSFLKLEDIATTTSVKNGHVESAPTQNGFSKNQEASIIEEVADEVNEDAVKEGENTSKETEAMILENVPDSENVAEPAAEVVKSATNESSELESQEESD